MLGEEVGEKGTGFEDGAEGPEERGGEVAEGWSSEREEMERGEEEQEGGGLGLSVVVVEGGFEGGVQVG